MGPKHRLSNPASDSSTHCPSWPLSFMRDLTPRALNSLWEVSFFCPQIELSTTTDRLFLWDSLIEPLPHFFACILHMCLQPHHQEMETHPG
jgi:hypothetical protein